MSFNVAESNLGYTEISTILSNSILKEPLFAFE